MSLFEKAKSSPDRVKMYIYGKTGTGKTRTALHFPSPAVIDAEQGTKFYGGEFEFFVINTSDPDKVHAAIDELLIDPQGFKTLVIDPFTVIYDNIIRNKEIYMRQKTGNMKYELAPLDYKSIKTEVKILMNKLLALDMNVIVTARSKDLYAKGKFMEVIGETPEGHKDLPYMFDIVIQLYVNEKGERRAKLDKDRSNQLPSDFVFSYDSFVEYIGIEELSRNADVEKQTDNINRLYERNSEIDYKGEKIHTAGITAETLEILENLLTGVPQDKVVEVLKESYEVQSLLDLTEKQARAFANAIAEE